MALDIPLPADPTLDEMRASLGPAIAREAVFEGWGDAALAAAATTLGIDPAHARLAFPDGAVGMIASWYAAIDAAVARDFPPERIAAMKVRDRIGALVLARLDYCAPTREAVRRALAILAQPRNLATTAKLGWSAADSMWRIAGDTATDLNHYTKRATLSAVYAATVFAWLDDESVGGVDTRAFLQRRLEGVMRFEKLKARLKPDPERTFSFIRLAGRLRYPAR